ncbi:hypothetical protein BCV70DRAFT_159040 [Testicularia cyperi]|uniref:Glycosyltransferase family 69 protein n=1 Tax=Testicularia cyperi TaxID=1882483 RepID=A0A317XSK0_9BASI|nr:hypothetical protein BCV70DRAFT_159040 [Testicularia cyperi]
MPKPCSPRRALPGFLIIVLATTAAFAVACVHFQTFTTLYLYLAILTVAFPLLTLLRLFARASASGMEHVPAWLCSLVSRFYYLLGLIWFAALIETLFSQSVLLGGNDDLDSRSAERDPPQIKVFVASNLYNSERILPRFSDSLKELISLIGADNAFVSIYESHSKDRTRALLGQLQTNLAEMNVEHRILSDDRAVHQDVHSPVGSRVDFLAQVRNIAMEPLQFTNVSLRHRYTHVLWINDIVFSPRDAYELLVTNDGHYDQTCAIDYIGNGFYDTWVTRDVDDNTLKRNWPYFSREEDITALRSGTPFLVNSCWNGLTAFAAKWFMDSDASPTDTLPGSSDAAEPPLKLPLRFRSSPTCFSSECQLTSYDLHRAVWPLRPRIYINPKVQVAYRHAHYYMYNTLIPSPLSRVWRKLWRDWISFRLFGWMSEYRRWDNLCRGAFKQWAAPDAPLAS